ncbi:MAG: DUF2059 domain-containing protein [Alphaproteobacteria bacterium]|nr:MAG: DUF2059 domain-containing protein [Alphaproteobacteria bacterium]
MKMPILAAMLLAGAAPAFAQAPAPAPTVSVETSVDPQRLAAAKITVDRVWPLGTYERMMRGTFDQVMDATFASMMDLKMEDMLPAGTDLGKADPELLHATMREAMAKYDPHFQERTRITYKVMMDEMIPIMNRMEPDVRETLARVYARRFTVEQLGDLNRFFDSPTGRAYASEAMLIMTDPEMARTMAGMAPELMKSMPSIMKKVQTATAHLPLPKPPKGKRG